MKTIDEASNFLKKALAAAAQLVAPDSEAAGGSAGESNAESRDQIIVLAQKLLARLPANGATLLLANLSRAHTHAGVVISLARSLEVISSKPVLLVDSTGLSGVTGNRTNGDSPGLMNVLRGSATLEQTLLSTNWPAVKRVKYGAAGDEATELMVSGSFRDLLRQSRKQFPWVILQCDWARQPEQSTCLMSCADAALATLKRGEGSVRDLRRFGETCAQLKSEFLGVVLT
jgi:Mrp family chromosome partitioning ATPase